jgi:hypothetical protein
VDVEILHVLVLVRLLQDASVDVQAAAALFGDGGEIIQACGGQLRAAAAVWSDLVKHRKQLRDRKLGKIEHKEEDDKLSARATKRARELTRRAVEELEAKRHAGKTLPSTRESAKAAAIITEAYYSEALHSLGAGPERQQLQQSHHFFRMYSESLDDMAALGRALLELPKLLEPRETAHAGTTVGHALRTVVMLAAVLRSSGHHRDRHLFAQEVERIISETLFEEATKDEQNKLTDVRSSVFLCFTKVLGDVPGAFTSNSKRSRRGGRTRREATKGSHVTALPDYREFVEVKNTFLHVPCQDSELPRKRRSVSVPLR